MDNTISNQILSDLSQNIFQFLGIAIAVSTFIPTLVYGYARNLQSDIDGGGEELAKRIASFIYAIDLLVTQTMALVSVVAITGLWSYIHISLAQLCNIYYSSYSLGLVILYGSYLGLLFISEKEFRTRRHIEFQYARWWPNWRKYEKVFYVLAIYATIQITLSIALLCNCYSSSDINFYEQFITVVMLSISTLILIIAGLSWIIPLGDFHPLTTILRRRLNEFNSPPLTGENSIPPVEVNPPPSPGVNPNPSVEGNPTPSTSSNPNPQN